MQSQFVSSRQYGSKSSLLFLPKSDRPPISRLPTPNRSAILGLRQACALDSRGSISFLALGNRKRLQLFPYHTHLLAGLVEEAGVVDHIIGGFDFFCFGELRCHAALDFLAGEVEG